MVSSKSNLTCEAGCGLTVSCSDRPRIGNDVLSVFIDFLKKFTNGILRGRCRIW